ncbi:MAG: metallophosphoesterase family protein [Desulfatiglandaceae bacterium]|jgi:serine/threonine protein phosphatase 1
MNNERTFIVGDIHGCLDMLKRMMEKIQWQPEKDNLIFLGDYIDRGEDPKGVVDYILTLQKSSSRIQCLLGNHEAIFLDYLSGRDKRLFLLNGGYNTLESYDSGREGSDRLIPEDHLAFYESLKTYCELENYYVVHAGFKPGIPILEQDREDMVWIRDPFIFSSHDFGKRVIFGHTPFSEPLVLANKIGLDTGAVYGNKLTCLELPEFIFHATEA